VKECGKMTPSDPIENDGHPDGPPRKKDSNRGLRLCLFIATINLWSLRYRRLEEN